MKCFFSEGYCTCKYLKPLLFIIGEENEENCSWSSNILSDESDRCPVCLNCLADQEVGFPETCSHIFCMACILKWAEVSRGGGVKPLKNF